MRTTLSLDPDVAAELERRRRAGHGLKQEVNRLLRVGILHDAQEHEAATGPFTEAASLGDVLVGSLDDVAGALARAEGDDHR